MRLSHSCVVMVRARPEKGEARHGACLRRGLYFGHLSKKPSPAGRAVEQRVMDKSSITQHISQQYNAELEDIREKVLTMGGLVEKNIADAIEAVVTGNSALGEEVISSDYKVNSMEVAIDEECARVLARRQPAAGDLRLITMVIKTITDLERIGDEAEKIARMAIELSAEQEKSKTSAPFSELRHLGDRVRQMLHDALDCFARMDVEASYQCIKADKEVDKEYEAIMRQLITLMMEDPRHIRRSLDVMWCARSLERIGDHATNICEYVIYMVLGKDVRHTSLEQVKAEIRGE